MIRHGAQLAFAYARATVPRIASILRKSLRRGLHRHGLQDDGQRPLPGVAAAEMAVMGAKGAVEILHRRADPRSGPQRELDYEERLLNPYVAAERGYVDAVIDPADTRRAWPPRSRRSTASASSCPRRRQQPA